ncbi:hypothetical protein [Halostagnicola bangensis]
MCIDIDPNDETGVFRIQAADEILSLVADAHDTEFTIPELVDLWRNHRSKTYYQDGLAAASRAEAMSALATEIHTLVVGRSAQGHECFCDHTI